MAVAKADVLCCHLSPSLITPRSYSLSLLFSLPSPSPPPPLVSAACRLPLIPLKVHLTIPLILVDLFLSNHVLSGTIFMKTRKTCFAWEERGEGAVLVCFHFGATTRGSWAVPGHRQ